MPGGPGSLLILGKKKKKKKESLKEEKLAGQATKDRPLPPSPPPLAQGLDTPLEWYML